MRCRRTRGPPVWAIRSRDRRAPGDRLGQGELESCHHGPGIGEGGGIGHGRARSDHRGIVARHVRDRQRRHRGGVGAARQPPALDAGEVLAHGVDVADPGAGFEQGAVHGLLFGERQSGNRRNPVGRSSARHQHQHEIAGGGACGERQGAFRPGKACRIGDGMAGFHDLDDARRAAIAAPGDRHARYPCRRGRGRGNGLPRSAAMAPAAFPAARMMSRPAGGASGRCGGKAARGMGGRDGGSIKLGQEGARWIHE